MGLFQPARFLLRDAVQRKGHERNARGLDAESGARTATDGFRVAHARPLPSTDTGSTPAELRLAILALVGVGLLHAIGVVRSPLATRADAPRQGDEGAPDAIVVLEPAYADALAGIRVGDELVLLTWLHEANRNVLQVHPRDDETRPLTGVFATRSSDRPNPIGLHRVTVLAIDGAELAVGPLEAIDGTPVVDIKVSPRD